MPASLRSDGVRVHPGMPFGIILDSAFGFAGIPNIAFAPETLSSQDAIGANRSYPQVSV